MSSLSQSKQIDNMTLDMLQLCPILFDPVDPARLLCPRDSPGKDTGVGRHALLQEIFLTQGLNLHLLCLLHWQGNFFTTNTTRVSNFVFVLPRWPYY